MSRPSRARVTAVVVVVGDSPYLQQTLEALAAQTVAPDRVVVAHAEIEAGSIKELAKDAGLAADLAAVDGAEGIGPAVISAAAAAGIDTPWLWLLHDDSAPLPGALAALTQVVETGRSIAVAGSKQVAWNHPDRLVSVGARYTRDLQRFTGIEDGEVDQGQHDDREDIDAVGTAGMLVDRELFATLGGPDPALGPFGDGRDISRRARLAGHRVVVVPRAVVRHARASYLGLRREGRRAPEPDPTHSFRKRRTSILHSRLTEARAPFVPLVALLALVAAPVRAVGRLVSKEIPLVADELWAPLAALGGWRSVLRARKRLTRAGSRSRLRPLQASWGDVLGVRRDKRLQAAAQRRTVRAPSELEMKERAALGRRRRLVLAGVLVLAAAVAGITLAPIAFSGPLLGGALLPADGSFAELWRAATSPWLATGDGWAVPADPFLMVLGVLSALTGGPFGTPVWVTISIVLVLAIPLSALTAWFASGAATRSLALRAWAAVIWALAPPLVLAIAGGRLGPLVAHVLLPLVALGLARAFGLDRRDVVVSGLVGARRVEPRVITAPAAELRKRRLAALAAVADDAPTGQIQRVLSGEELDALGAAEAQGEGEAEKPGSAVETSERSAAAEKPHGASDSEDLEQAPAIVSNTAEPYEAEEEEFATIVAKPSGVGSIGAAAAAGLCLAAAAAGAPVLLPAALLCLLALALLLPRKGVAGRSRLLLVAVPPLVLLGPLLTHALQVDGGWRLLLSGPGAVMATPTSTPLLALLGWPQDPPAAGIASVSQWLVLAASATVAVAAVVSLARGGALARGVRFAWLVAAVGAAAAVLAPRVEVGIAQRADGTAVVANGWGGAGTSLLLLGLVTSTAIGWGGLRAALHGRNFGWRQLGVALISIVLVGGIALAAVGWTTMLRSEVLTLTTRHTDPVPAIGDELQTSDARARVLALWATDTGVVDAELWRLPGPQLTETSSALALADLDRTEIDPVTDSLRTIVAGLATGTLSGAADALAGHAVGVVVVPPLDSAVTGSTSDDVGRDRLIALLDSVRGLERVTENDSGVVWRVSTEETAVGRVLLVAADGTTTRVPADVVGVRTELPATEGAATLVLAERPDAGWHAWLDGDQLRAVTHGWQQAFEVPAGVSGELVVRYDDPLATPWRIVIGFTFVVVALIALPTRRRRLEPLEEQD
ncbi:glycosyltransferase [Pseudactinotalea terrae]|uniref:glycosyltransferase n=1 Tax=Pseudactinotalea terrae TaxID=1743262 RepID=UPI0012E26C84|nr:glycosyltransferase [Pseudactinotalea terrae]